jgi:CRP-like cAMP-binding protein
VNAREQLAAALGDDAAELLWPHLELVRFSANHTLFRDGVPSSHLYLVVDGNATVQHESSSGPLLLGVRGPGAWLGEIGFIDGGPATATVIVGEPVTALTIDHAALVELQTTHPHAALVLLRKVTRELAVRLQHSTAGCVEEVADGHYRVREAEQAPSWLTQALGWLLVNKKGR